MPPLWEGMLDGRFTCVVVRKGEYNGTLEIHDGDKLIAEMDVELSFGAPFGPDVADVNAWIDQCIGAVDKYNKAEKEKEKEKENEA